MLGEALKFYSGGTRCFARKEQTLSSTAARPPWAPHIEDSDAAPLHTQLWRDGWGMGGRIYFLRHLCRRSLAAMAAASEHCLIRFFDDGDGGEPEEGRASGAIVPSGASGAGGAAQVSHFAVKSTS